MKPKTTTTENALCAAMAALNEACGHGTIQRLDSNKVVAVESISTGCLSLDLAIGVGGLPRGRMTEIFGPESSGKTTIALQAIANAQKAGGNAVFIDVEQSLDPVYAKNLGVDMESLWISQPDSAEDALKVLVDTIETGLIDIVVLDSIAALVPKAELAGEVGDAHVGKVARLMSQVLRILAASVKKTNTCLVFTNQLRHKIGVLFGSPETTPGGRAMRFYASVRLDVRRIGQIKEGDLVIGNRTKVTVKKNKVAPPFRYCEFDVFYGEGTSRPANALDEAVNNGIVDKSGSWFSYGEERLGHGRAKCIERLKSDPDLLSEIELKIMEKLLAK